jgi:hypothetical protein
MTRKVLEIGLSMSHGYVMPASSDGSGEAFPPQNHRVTIHRKLLRKSDTLQGKIVGECHQNIGIGNF